MWSPKPPSTVYFIRRTDGVGPIKIGETRGSLNQRLTACRHGNPYPLDLCRYVIDGDGHLEVRLHVHFDDHRMAGEWFAPVPQLVKLAEQGSVAGLSDVLGDATIRERPEPPRHGPKQGSVRELVRQHLADLEAAA